MEEVYNKNLLMTKEGENREMSGHEKEMRKRQKPKQM